MPSRRSHFLSALLAATLAACAAPPPPDPVDPDPTDPGEPPAVVDSAAPSLVSSSPAHGQSGVAPDAVLSLTFSEPMDPFSLMVVALPEHDFAAGVWSEGDTVVSFPSMVGKMPPGAQLSLSISGADKSGNPLAGGLLSFTVAEAADLAPPEVAQAQPAAGSSDAAINAAISITFSEPMNEASVEGAVSIAPSVAGSVTWDESGATYTLAPNAALAGSTQYTVTVGVGAKDAAGNALAAPHVYSFTTAAVADTTKPSAVSSAPGTNEMGVARNANISITFSEPMNKAATQAAFSITSPAGFTTGAYSWSADGRTMTFNPQGTFAFGQPVAWRVTTDAQDLAGNALTQAISRGFYVVRQGTLVLEAMPALDGHITSAGTVSTGASMLFVGDSVNVPSYRGFLSFDLNALPENLLRVTNASLYVFLHAKNGDPVANLGGAAKLERVSYGNALTASDYDVQRFTGLFDSVDFISTLTSGWKVNGQLALGVFADWSDRNSRDHLSQYRVRFPTQYDNGEADYVQLHSADSIATYCPRPAAAANGSSACKPHLVVIYEYP